MCRYLHLNNIIKYKCRNLHLDMLSKVNFVPWARTSQSSEHQLELDVLEAKWGRPWGPQKNWEENEMTVI